MTIPRERDFFLKSLDSVLPIVTMGTNCMRLLGVAESWVKDGYLVVKPVVSNPSSYLGAIAHDSQGHRIGRVVDIIGRVDDPRIVVRLDYRELGELIASRKDRVYYSLARKTRK